LQIKQIKYQSPEYEQSVILRDKILRKPLGMVFTDEFLKQDAKEFMIGLFDQNQIKAVLHLKPFSDTVLKMRQVAVDENMQGKGYGSKLVLFSEEFARNKNYKKFVLHARETAVSFYKKLNYNIIGEQFFEVGISHFKMEKKL